MRYAETGDNLLTRARTAMKPRYVNDPECDHVRRMSPAIPSGVVAQRSSVVS
jgi:hypothetical protein